MRQRHTTHKHLAKMHNMTNSAKNSCVCKYYQDSQIHELAANSEKDSRRVSWGFYSAGNRHHGCCKILWLIKLALYSPLTLLLRLCLYIYTWIFLHIFFWPLIKKDSHAHQSIFKIITSTSQKPKGKRKRHISGRGSTTTTRVLHKEESDEWTDSEVDLLLNITLESPNHRGKATLKNIYINVRDEGPLCLCHLSNKKNSH